MFDVLNDYEKNDHFFYTGKESLESVCNVPNDGIGVFLVYELKNGRIRLVYVGSSDEILQKGAGEIKKGSIKDRIVNGSQFNEPRKVSWKKKIADEQIEALDVYWYITSRENYQHNPFLIETQILQTFFEVNGEFPEWNKEI